MIILIWIYINRWFIFAGIVSVLWLAFILSQDEIKEWLEGYGLKLVLPEWLDFTTEDE